MQELLKKFGTDSMEAKMLHLWNRVRELRLGEFPHDKFDLTVSQMELIMFVGRFPGAHLQDVAEGLKLTSPTVSVGIRKLEEEGLIERKPDPNDGRAACFFLTEVSMSALLQLTQAGLSGMRRFLSHLDQEEQSQLHLLLEKAVSGVEKDVSARS